MYLSLETTQKDCHNITCFGASTVLIRTSGNWVLQFCSLISSPQNLCNTVSTLHLSHYRKETSIFLTLYILCRSWRIHHFCRIVISSFQIENNRNIFIFIIIYSFSLIFSLLTQFLHSFIFLQQQCFIFSYNNIQVSPKRRRVHNSLIYWRILIIYTPN
jgi:hypothetical protein